MARVELTRRALANLDQIFDHLARYDISTAASRVFRLTKALAVLESSPLLGHPLARQRRELVIGRRSQRYLALYRYDDVNDLVVILAIRSERQARYP